MNNNVNVEENILFTNYVSGIKDMHYNTDIILVNDIINKAVNLVYGKGTNQIFIFPYNCLNNITYTSRVRMSTSIPKSNEYETRNALLSAVVFGGNPIMQILGNKAFNYLSSSLTNNYSKVNYNTYYEIVIPINTTNGLINIKLTSDIDPKNIIDKINNR